MTQENKELLTQDLCARLPYGVKFAHKNGFDTLEGIVDDFINPTNEYSYNVEEVKPFLFPMSSMTEEQREEFNDLTHDVFVHKSGECNNINEYDNTMYSDIDDWLISINWLNAHHFDYRGLIEKGLAIDATDLNIY